MKQANTQYKKAAFLTFVMRKSQGQVSQDEFDVLVDNVVESADCAGLINGHFYMHYDGSNTLKLSVPCSDVAGNELSVGMALGGFVERVSREKMFDFWSVSSGIEEFRPDLPYVSLTEY